MTFEECKSLTTDQRIKFAHRIAAGWYVGETMKELEGRLKLIEVLLDKNATNSMLWGSITDIQMLQLPGDQVEKIRERMKHNES